MSGLDPLARPASYKPGWAGAFDCSQCRRKRLIAAEFSKAQVKKFRADPLFQLKCLKCVAELEKSAADTASSTGGGGGGSASASSSGADTLVCAACKAMLPDSGFTKNQLKKGAGKQCRACVDAAETSASSASSEAQKAKHASLKEASVKAQASGTALEKAKVAAACAAAEAEFVTGLKPMVLGRGKNILFAPAIFDLIFHTSDQIASID